MSIITNTLKTFAQAIYNIDQLTRGDIEYKLINLLYQLLIKHCFIIYLVAEYAL